MDMVKHVTVRKCLDCRTEVIAERDGFDPRGYGVFDFRHVETGAKIVLCPGCFVALSDRTTMPTGKYTSSWVDWHGNSHLAEFHSDGWWHVSIFNPEGKRIGTERRPNTYVGYRVDEAARQGRPYQDGGDPVRDGFGGLR